MRLFTQTRLSVISQVFANLAAGWYGVVLIIPGVSNLASLGDWVWLTKNLLFGTLALSTAIIFAEKGKNDES